MDLQDRISTSTIEELTSGRRKFSIPVGKHVGEAWSVISSDFATHGLNGLVMFFLNVVAPFLQSGLFQGLFNARTKNEKIEIGTLFKGFDNAGKIVWFYVVSLVLGFILGIVAVVFMIPITIMAEDNPGIFMIFLLGFYFMIFLMSIMLQAVLMYAICLMTFSRMDGMESIKASYAIFKNNMGTTFMLAFVIFLLQLGGLALCYVGMIITYPLGMMATYFACNKIFKIEDGVIDPTDEIIEHLI
jgi:hypothetical protein